MVLFNYSTKELTAKIVYYGPGLCGKTTNLQYVFDNLPPNIHKGKMLSLATKTDRTLFFDFLPIDLGMIRGMRTRLQLYTVPGQVFYNTTRKLVLKGADGVVFVADSQRKMLDADVESFRNLEQNLEEHGLKLSEMPHVIQFNKRDLPAILSCEELNAALNKYNAPIYEAVATTGIGVQDTLKAVTRLVLNSLKEKYGEARKHPVVEPAVAVATAVAAAPVRPVSRAPEPEPVLEVGDEIPPEPILEERPGAPAPSGEIPADAAPVLDLDEPAAPPEEALLEAEEEPVLSLEEPEVTETIVADVVEEEASPLTIGEPAPEAVALEEEPQLVPAPSDLRLAAGTAEEPVAEEFPDIEPITGEEVSGAEPVPEGGPSASPPPAEESPSPLPVAAAEPFEVEVTSVEPSVPAHAESALGAAEPHAVASFETRAVALAGPSPSAGETSQEAALPFVIDVGGQTLHLKVTITVRIERP